MGKWNRTLLSTIASRPSVILLVHHWNLIRAAYIETKIKAGAPLMGSLESFSLSPFFPKLRPFKEIEFPFETNLTLQYCLNTILFCRIIILGSKPSGLLMLVIHCNMLVPANYPGIAIL